MLYDGISLTENASIQNAAIDHGTVFPIDTSVGELFFRSDLNKMFVHNGSAWEEVGATLNASTIAGALGYTPASLDESNKVPLAQLPAVAITDTFVAASEAAMLALSAQTGDIAIRTDLNKTYILQGSAAATLANWKELLVSPSVAAAGTHTQIQFNNSGVLGTSPHFTYNYLTGTLVLGSAFTTAGNIVPSNTQSSIVISGGSPAWGEGGTAGGVTLRGGSGVNDGSQGSGSFWGTVGGTLTLAGGNGGSNGSGHAGSGGNIVISGGLRGTIGGGGSAGHIIQYTNDVERFRINPNGSWSIGVGGTLVGTAGQVLTSNGDAPPTWSTVTAVANANTLSGTTLAAGVVNSSLSLLGATVTLGTTAATLTSAAGQTLTINPGISSGAGGTSLNITGAIGNGAGNRAGSINITGGAQSGAGSNTPAGDVNVVGGYGGLAGGSILIKGGNADLAGPADGGWVHISTGVSGTGTSHSQAIYFSTCTPGATATTERFRINPNGSWSVGAGGAATGTAGQVLTSNGNAPPTWSTPTTSTTLPSGYTEGTSAITAAATTTVNCATSNNFLVNMSANITSLAFSNIPASGKLYRVTLFLNYTGAFTVTWPASVKWSGGTAPTLTSSANKTDIITLTTRDGGVTWYGISDGMNF